MSTVRLALHKNLNLKTPNKQVRVVWWKLKKLNMEKHY